MNKTVLLLLLLCISFVLHARSADSISTQIDKMVLAYEDIYGFSGTVKVVLHENPVFEKSYGLANRSFNIANQPETRFSINSISKTFLATAIMMLAADHQLDLQAPVGKYLSSLTASWKDSVTLNHLLTHTSGLPRESGIHSYDEMSLQQQVGLVNKQSLLFSPGEKYAYSNSGIILLGAVLEAVSGTNYATFMEQKIVRPLDLQNTGFYHGRSVVKKLATPYRLTSNGLEFAQRSKHYGDNPGGGMYSTVDDLYRYVTALEQNKLLSPEYTQLLFTPHVQSGENEFEGYTWSIKHFGDETIYFAAGSGYGTKSVLIRSPKKKNFIAITANWGNTPILQMLSDLFLISAGQNPEPPASRNLARPNNYTAQLGLYEFNRDDLKKHLGMDKSTIKLQPFAGKLFLNDELLAQKESGLLGLTYTDELTIAFKGNRMIITINGNRIVGIKK